MEPRTGACAALFDAAARRQADPASKELNLKTELNALTAQYASLAAIPSLSSASFARRQDIVRVNAKWSQTDCSRNSRQKLRQKILLKIDTTKAQHGTIFNATEAARMPSEPVQPMEVPSDPSVEIVDVLPMEPVDDATVWEQSVRLPGQSGRVEGFGELLRLVKKASSGAGSNSNTVGGLWPTTPSSQEYVLERWGSHGMEHAIVLPSHDLKLKHGAIQTGGDLGAPVALGQYVAYAAELLPAGGKAAAALFPLAGEAPPAADAPASGTEFGYRDILGEQMYESRHVGAFVVCFPAFGNDDMYAHPQASCFRLDLPTEAVAVGNFSWSPDGARVAATVFLARSSPQQFAGKGHDTTEGWDPADFGADSLGLRFCSNRTSSVVVWNVAKHAERERTAPALDSNDAESPAIGSANASSEEKKGKEPIPIEFTVQHTRSARSPRFYSDSAIVFLASPHARAHHNCLQLCHAVLDTTGKNGQDASVAISVLQDVVYAQGTSENFPGIYTFNLSPTAACIPGMVFLDTAWNSRRSIVVLLFTNSGSTRAVELQPQGFEPAHGQSNASFVFSAWNILDIFTPDDLHVTLLLKASGPNQPDTLFIGTLAMSSIREVVRQQPEDDNHKQPDQVCLSFAVTRIAGGTETNSKHAKVNNVLQDMRCIRWRISADDVARVVKAAAIASGTPPFDNEAQDCSEDESKFGETSAPLEYILQYRQQCQGSGTCAARPLLLPHGGPHVNFAGDFAIGGTLLATQRRQSDGCECEHTALIMVNYRGSTGFGQEPISVLATGKCGNLDVVDCAVALAHACTVALPALGFTTIVEPRYIGGSHGGFLGGHLLAWQNVVDASSSAVAKRLCLPTWSRLMESAVSVLAGGSVSEEMLTFASKLVLGRATLRNPVIDIASMANITDIPDWCVAEAGLSPAGALVDYDALHACSPMAWWDDILLNKRRVDGAETAEGTVIRQPTLIMIGGRDARVPPFQGRQFFRALRATNAPCDMRAYPAEGHSLAGAVTAEADMWLSCVLWLHHEEKDERKIA